MKDNLVQTEMRIGYSDFWVIKKNAESGFAWIGSRANASRGTEAQLLSRYELTP